ncbi:GAF and ANTAR domain-containing protein [Kribbella sancticallisti]|uniref:GAF and ANTAR domain-containing protein n=1 Tax=Kribbella sancticallisti TaxID=460087 RepID=A0ABN2DUE0_9ACTN
MTGHDTTGAGLPERAVRELAAATATLVADHDVIGSITSLLHGCADSVEAAAAGIIVTAPGRGLEFLAGTDHRAEHLELYQVQVDEGPGVDCVAGRRPVTVVGLAQVAARWPSLLDAFLAAGFDGVHAAPMAWRGQMLGAVNLFFDSKEPRGETALVAQAFADIASLVILRNSPLAAADIAARTQAALADRVIIERAKGVIAYIEDLSMDAAFDRLVMMARERRHPLTAVAASVVDQAAGESSPR